MPPRLSDPTPPSHDSAPIETDSGAQRSRAPHRTTGRVVRGDWQTPSELARAVVEALGRDGVMPGSVLEPTCGRGSFLEAAAHAFPAEQLRGYDIEPGHVVIAREVSVHATAERHAADFFEVDWHAIVRSLPEPVLILGNPPWVTSAAVGRLEGTNLPPKTNDRRARGI